MGNKKNKNNKRNSSHRHVYYKRKGVEKKTKLAINEKPSGVDLEAQTSKVAIEGSRIINISKLQEYINDLTKHSSECEGFIILSGESRDGLASILESRCSSCQKVIAFETSTKVKGPKGYSR